MLETVGKSVGKLVTDVASDVFKLSDLCQVVKPCDYDKTLSDNYTLAEDGEEIYYLLKSRTDEYCFTNRALIVLDSERATDGGKSIIRYEFSNSVLEDIRMNTPNRVDLSAELIFTLDKNTYTISVDRSYTKSLNIIYKILTEIELMQIRASKSFEICEKSVKYATSALGKLAQTKDILGLYTNLVQFNEDYLNNSYEYSFGYDLTELFKKYIPR